MKRKRDADAYRARLNRLIPMADIVKLSGDDLEWLYPDTDPAEAARRVLDLGPRIVLHTGGASGASRWLGNFILKINFHRTLAVLTFTAVPLAVHKVGTIAIDLTDRWLQVMHVAFHLAIFRVFGAVFAPAVLPALTLMAELPCRHYVLPFNPAGAVLIFTHFIAAGFQIDNAFFPLPYTFSFSFFLPFFTPSSPNSLYFFNILLAYL